MGHHKTGHHHQDEFMVGKDNQPKTAEQKASSTIDVVEEKVESGTEFSRPQMLQQRFRELKVASNGAIGDLRSGLGTAAHEVRSGLGTAITQIKQSMTKAAGRFNGVLHLAKSEKSGRSAH